MKSSYNSPRFRTSLISHEKPKKGDFLRIGEIVLDTYIVTSFKKTKFYSCTKGDQEGWLVFYKLTDKGRKFYGENLTRFGSA